MCYNKNIDAFIGFISTFLALISPAPNAEAIALSTTTPPIAIEDTFLYAVSSPNVWEEPAEIVEINSTTTASKNPLPDSCFCVRVARQAGLNLPFVDAKDLKHNSGPILNGGILFQYGPIRHVAVIKAFLKDGYWVYEGNFNRCKTGNRLVFYNDPAIIGFIR